MRELNDSLMNEWREALESGKYQQCLAYLCLEDEDGNRRYCCLGVLMELVYGNEWETFRPVEGETALKIKDEYQNLSLEVSEWLEDYFKESHCAIENDLTRMNDSDGKTFKEISGYLGELDERA